MFLLARCNTVQSSVEFLTDFNHVRLSGVVTKAAFKLHLHLTPFLNKGYCNDFRPN